jgi:hypothetical protein
VSGKLSRILITLGALWTFSAIPPLAHCVRLFFNNPAPRASLLEMGVLWSIVLLAGPFLARGSKWGRALTLALLPLIGLNVLSWLAMCILEENYDLPLISFSIFLIVLSVTTSIILVK